MKKLKTKVYSIISKEFDTRMELGLFSYIFGKGIENLREVTEDDIKEVEGNAFMTQEFCQQMVRCAVRISKECTFPEIMEYVRLHLNFMPEVREINFAREDYSRGKFWELLNDLNLADEQVGDAFSAYVIVDGDSLKEEW